MTAGELKKILSQIPDDMEVVKYTGEQLAISVYEAITFNVKTRTDSPTVHHLTKSNGKKVFLIN